MASSSTAGTRADTAWVPGCMDVLRLVAEERVRQVARYGSNDDLEHGFGPNTRWLLPYTTASATDVEAALRQDYEDFEAETGKPTWVHLIREELAEAFMEDDVLKREAEAIQVAALLVSFVETSRRLRTVEE